MPESTRKLAAIMFTDIVGYSHLMSADEKKALELLDKHDQILHQAIINSEGKVLKKMGDAIFAEFRSSVNAVNCAIKIQLTLKEYNEGKPIDDMIIIRIGIHLGDVIVHGDDLFGEGINVAARLEPLAPPGGICLSQAVYQSVKSRTDISAVRIGEVELKNIIQKYTVYKIPPFYAEDLSETTDLEQKEEHLLDFKIKGIQNLPPPSRSVGSVFGWSLLLFHFG
ncbi:MAG: adenylate/guanylate cyclase domain-containing protein [Candidatus Marinimicrobia bacterium]|nr:adenylate/guanylate cyclase domain-containing protein [Candidatus Neomarinimicrobiota bacterium]